MGKQDFADTVAKKLLGTFMLLFGILVSVSAHAAPQQIALIIGNSDYQQVSKLRNPQNDVKLAQETFEALDFVTLVAINQTQAQLRTLLNTFKLKSENADVAIIYFAGHGIQVDGKNFLLSIDTDATDLRSVQATSLELKEFFAAFAATAGTKLLMLDACRDNPFSENTRSVASKIKLATRGLARAQHQVKDLLVLYAAQPNNIAYDGKGENSPFAAAISSALTAHKKVSLSTALIDITNNVRTHSADRQIPYIEGTLSIHVEFKMQLDVSITARQKPDAACSATPTTLFFKTMSANDGQDFPPNKNSIKLKDEAGMTVEICPAQTGVRINGPFDTHFSCAQMKEGENEGIGYYFSDTKNHPAHLWFYVDPKSGEGQVEMGIYRNGKERLWVTTGWHICQ